MGVPDDANPLNRRLPAEVVSRRRKVEKEDKEETNLAIDRGQVLGMKPEQRCKWLMKALQRAQVGRASLNDIYDVVAHTKFPSDATDKVGYRMYCCIRANLGIFSSKQQRFLGSECRLAQLFGRHGDGVAAESAASSGNISEDMLARCQSFAQEKQREREQSGTGEVVGHDPVPEPAPAPAPEPVPAPTSTQQEDIAALWDRLTNLSAAQREEAVSSLDPETKERLENWLEARILRARSSVATSTHGSGSATQGSSADSTTANVVSHSAGGTASTASSSGSRSPTPAASCSANRGNGPASRHSGSEARGGAAEAEKDKSKDKSSGREVRGKKERLERSTYEKPWGRWQSPGNERLSWTRSFVIGLHTAAQLVRQLAQCRPLSLAKA